MKKVRTLILSGILAGMGFAATEPNPFPAHPSRVAKHITMSEDEIETVHVGYGYSTLFILPDGEEAMEALGGDKGKLWDVEFPKSDHRVVAVKPKHPGIRNTITIHTNHKNFYTYVLEEVGTSSTPYEVKVFIHPDKEMAEKIAQPAEYIRAEEAQQQIRQVQSQAERDEAELQRQRTTGQQKMDDAQAKLLSSVRTDYQYDHKKARLLGVEGIFHDDRRTLIRVNTQELPVVNEISGGKVDLTRSNFDRNIYVVQRVLREGEVVHGKEKMMFRLQGD